MIYYILEHAKTGDCMPEMKRGYTYWEPGSGVEPVRLFTSYAGALHARRWWAAGTAYNTHSSYDDFGDCDTELRIKPVPGRSKSDLEIVAVRLTKDINKG